MINRWVDIQIKENEEFNAFLELYDALHDKKTADPVRLRGRIDRMWSGFTMEKKREYTQILLSLGKLDDNVASAVRTFGGVVTKFS